MRNKLDQRGFTPERLPSPSARIDGTNRIGNGGEIKPVAPTRTPSATSAGPQGTRRIVWNALARNGLNRESEWTPRAEKNPSTYRTVNPRGSRFNPRSLRWSLRKLRSWTSLVWSLHLRKAPPEILIWEKEKQRERERKIAAASYVGDLERGTSCEFPSSPAAEAAVHLLGDVRRDARAHENSSTGKGWS
jgi:hypothetical protein